MIELFGSALVTFLVIIDPPGCAPIFASLTRGTSTAHRRAMAIRSSLIAWAILMFFALLGKPMLQALGISLASFRIAGGIMLFFIALDMVFERRTERREKRAEEIEGTPEAEDISVFPMAIPMITGPGSIASAMLWVSRGPHRRNCRRPRGDHHGNGDHLADLTSGGPADADDWREGRSDDHADPRRDPGSARRSIRRRWPETKFSARPRLAAHLPDPEG